MKILVLLIYSHLIAISRNENVTAVTVIGLILNNSSLSSTEVDVCEELEWM